MSNPAIENSPGAKRWGTRAAWRLTRYANTIFRNQSGVATVPGSVNLLNRRC